MKINHIVVVGTGFGGWYTALGLLTNFPDIKITIIGSDKIPKLRVGESASFDAPYNLKRLMGLNDDRMFMRVTGATYKYGTRYFKLNSDTEFGSALGKFHNVKIGSLSRFFGGFDYPDFHEPWNFKPGDTGIQDAWLWEYKNTKKSAVDYENELLDCTFFNNNPAAPYNDNRYILRPNDGYSYHMDAEKTAHFCEQLIRQKHSDRITVINDVVDHVIIEHGSISELLLKNGSNIVGDLYCDVSGIHRALIKNFDNAVWKDCSEYSPDSAMVFPRLYIDPQKEMIATTTFRGEDYGWGFNIPLYHRTGNGYVFKKELADVDKIQGILGKRYNSKINTSLITWSPGYYEKPWLGNMLSLGIAANFINPYDANVIHVQSRGLDHLISVLKDQSTYNDMQNKFNQALKIVNEEIDIRLRMLWGFSTRSGDFWDIQREQCKKYNYLEILEKIITKKFTQIDEVFTWDWSFQYIGLIATMKLDISKFDIPKPSDADLEMARAFWQYNTARNNYIKQSSWPNYYEWLKANRYDGQSSEAILQEINPDLCKN